MSEAKDHPSKGKNPKICFWDLECSNLNANWGTILCGGFKFKGDKRPVVLDYKDFGGDPVNDKRLVSELSKRLSEADVWVTWYGKRFDVPFLNSRLLFHGLPPLPEVAHIDGWEIARYKLKLHSNRLACVQEFLRLPEEKTNVVGPVWLNALAGKRWALDYIVEHCEKDVEVLELAYEKLKPLGPKSVDVGVITSGQRFAACTYCGGSRLIKNGFRYSGGSIYQRLICRGCGGHLKGKRTLVPIGRGGSDRC